MCLKLLCIKFKIFVKLIYFLDLGVSFFGLGRGRGYKNPLSFLINFIRIYLFIYWVKKNEHLSMKQGSLFVLFCTYEIH
jgi:hypothetical protein